MPSKTTSLNELASQLAEESIQMYGKDKAAGKSPLEYHMLMVTEIAEATECVRTDKDLIYFTEKGKPEGEAVELSDAIMRILNYCGHRGFDIDKALQLKREYNLKKRNWNEEGKNI